MRYPTPATVAMIPGLPSRLRSAETGTGSGGGNNTAANYEKAVKFAECMRNNGVKDFPDHTENGPLINVEGARSIPGFQAAAQKCLKVYSGELGGQ
jgi:hypothetical protein